MAIKNYVLAYGGTLNSTNGKVEDNHILSHTLLPENSPITSNVNELHVPMSFRRVIYPSKDVVDAYLEANPDLLKVKSNNKPVIDTDNTVTFNVNVEFPNANIV